MDALGINLGFFIAQLFNFGLIFLLLALFVWPRVTRMLDERAERIAKGLEDARAAEQARENAEQERERILAQARADSQKVIEEARQRGEEQVKQILRDANTEAEERRAQARVQAEEERNRILAEARNQIVSLAVAATERLLEQNLDTNSQQAILERFFSEVPAEARSLSGRVEVVSAVPLTDAEKSNVQQAIGAGEIEYTVDPRILGGLILRSEDQVVDGSVRGDLSALTARLN